MSDAPSGVARRFRAIRLLAAGAAALALGSCSGTALLLEVRQRVDSAWVSAHTYTVTFDAQGGSTPSPKAISVVSGETYGALPGTVRADYAFYRWRTGSGGTGDVIDADSTVTIESDQTLYADWVTPGSTWTVSALPNPSAGFVDWIKLAYGDSKFVAISSAQTSATSSDGTSWSQRTFGSEPGMWGGAAHGNDQFVAVWEGNDKTAYSTDGVQWTIHYEETTDRIPLAYWTSIVYGANAFVAVSRSFNTYSARSASSTDGKTWTSHSIPDRNWLSVAFGNNTFVTLAQSAAVAEYMPGGGTNWSAATDPPAAVDWIDVCYGEGLFVAIARDTDTYATSPNGIVWTNRTLPASRRWLSVAYGNGQFVAIAQYTNVVAISPDGLAWTEHELPRDSSWVDLAYGDNRFVAIAADGTVVASP